MSHNYNDGDIEQFVADVHAVLASTLVTTMKEKIGGLFEKYAVYKETHDAVMRIPAVRSQRPDLASLAMSEHDMLIQRLIAENDALRLQIEEMKSAHAPHAAHASLPECCEHHNDEHCSSTANIKLIITDINVSDVPTHYDDVDEDISENENVLAEESEKEDEEEEEDEVAEEEEDEVAEEEDVTQEEEVVTAEEEEDVAEEEEEEDVAEEEEEEDVAEEEDEVTAQEEEDVAEEEEDEVAAQEEEDVAEEEEEEDVAEEEDEEVVEVIEVEIKGKPYFTTDEISGIIYERTKDGDIGNEVGRFMGGRPKFDKK